MDPTETFRIGLEVSIAWIVLLVVLALAGRERKRSEAAVADLRALLEARLDALQQAIEEVAYPATAGNTFVPSTPENWESIREQWATCRRHLERAISGTTVRTLRSQLSALPRHTYEPVIEALRAAELLDLPTSDVLKRMDRRIAAIRRHRSATTDQAEEFSRLFDQVSPKLQRL